MGQAARLVLTQSLRKLGRAVITAGIATAALLPLQVVQAKQPDNGLASVQLAALPAEAQATERLVRAGGPFPYAKDGSVFGNRERLLPRKPRGHYRDLFRKRLDSEGQALGEVKNRLYRADASARGSNESFGESRRSNRQPIIAIESP